MIKNIRNFCIIAHIDHGKSTLADRLIQLTGTVDNREFRDQFLDSMDLERERGITIKASAVRMMYKANDGETYCLNLIDTPGHVDFTYEVSKAIAACEGAILVVDAVQGVEAQTIANLYLAMDHNLKILPLINKIDLKNARIEEVKHQMFDALGVDDDEILLSSAKEGTGIKEILEAVVARVPAPEGLEDAPLQALIFDSSYDIYRGVIVYVRIINGVIKAGRDIMMMNKGMRYEVKEVGVFMPKETIVDKLTPGEVGYIICNIKNASEVAVGDTVTDLRAPADKPLPGYKKVKPMVFSGIYPISNEDYETLKSAMGKLQLSDSSFVYEPETSMALGFGFRCGFLGLLHMDIVQERLEREFNLDLIITSPSVTYRVKTAASDVEEIDNPTRYPSSEKIEYVEEPYVRCFLIAPSNTIGNLMKLCENKRGEFVGTKYLDPTKIQITYNIPLAEIVVDFYDKIKSSTQGYGSLDYEVIGFRKSDIVKLDILLNGEVCDALSCIVHKDRARTKGQELAEKLKETIPKHMFKITIQAAIGGNVIAREDISALKKHVTGKCYGGDITRKRKLWEKQKEGKKKMRVIGSVEVPKEAFLKAMRVA
ncbi:GTP-binding protein LepA [Candidatus Omnitrophus magneticus]|uniref:Elongation factor 4 n=1 Tax=Candidatus Omnitrophus magneticus TaxID=1609969 RepID=A0A0F0CU83_9BACT|nr:GTP-binding protein LepA [Candidatus Omnitrophus magneticus]